MQGGIPRHEQQSLKKRSFPTPSDVHKHESERDGKGLTGKCHVHVQLQKQMKGQVQEVGGMKADFIPYLSYVFVRCLCWSAKDISSTRKRTDMLTPHPDPKGSCSAAEPCCGGVRCLWPCLLLSAVIS